MTLKNLSEKLFPTFLKNFDANPSVPCRLFLSASSLKERATVCNSVGNTPQEAWTTALIDLENALNKKGIEPKILRADWVTLSENISWAKCLARVQAKRRNWFRQGIAFDKNYRLAFTEQELNANLFFFNPDKEKTNGEFQPDKAQAYCRERFNCDFPQMTDAAEVELFNTAGTFIQEGMSEPLNISGKDASAGRRDIDVDKNLFFNLAMNATKYLLRQCEDDGKFTYGWYPYDDSIVPKYNTHRHFGTLFSMAEAYEVCADEQVKQALGAAIERGFEYAIRNLLCYRRTSSGETAAYFSEGRATTSGISGLSLLAFSKWTTVSGTQRYLPLMNALARGVFAMQKPEGNFSQALNIRDFSVRKDFIITFYDGEALFGLLRLYGITKDIELLKFVERAVLYFISQKYWEHHDHWMQYTLNELTIYKPEARYFRFGLDNILTYLPKIANSAVHAPTQLEMVMAAENMIQRMKTLPEMKDLLKRVDERELYSTADRRAERFANSYFFPEVAMYFKNPERMDGAFFARGDAFRVRIDDVQHTISGLLAYDKCLKGDSVVALEPTETGLVAEEIPPVAEEKISADSTSRTVIKAGAVRVTIETEDGNAIEFENGQPQIVSRVKPPLVVGIMKKVKNHFWEMSNARYPMFLMAAHFNIELLFFEPQDIDFENKTVKALTMKDGKVIQKVAPLPKIIDNDIMMSRGETAPIMNRLKEYCYLIRPIGGMGKQKFFNALSKDGRFNEFLITTYTVASFENLSDLLEQYGDVVLKPGNGVGGGGVFRVKIDDGNYVVTTKTQTTTLKNPEELLKLYNDNFTQKAYLLQPYVTSRTRQGNPFDIRIHARRGAEGKFKTFLYPRIGNADGVISNVVAGGFTMKLENFLPAEFGDDWKKVYNQLMDLADRFPDYYQSFYNDTIFDIGIDVGIQKRGDVYELKLFEAYIQPGFTLIRNEVAVTNFEYYRYIDKRLREGSL